jgi:large subunit ribosomal protein L10
MPTKAKAEAIDEIIQLMKDCSIAISADYSGLNVPDMSSFRTILRENGMKFKVIKNTLLRIAAEQADWPEMKELIDGQTGIAFGYGDEQISAKLISNYIKDSGSDIELKMGLIGSQRLSGDEIKQLAALPGREELVSKLVGQLHGQLSGLVFTLNSPLLGAARVLNAPLLGLATVLQGKVDQG